MSSKIWREKDYNKIGVEDFKRILFGWGKRINLKQTETSWKQTS